ncbi:MAG: hypothetical protein QOE60_160 [Thermoleophilaceae bacterium]|nr:hypothetical protein [Thermoleophilaceae bacterium]
MIHVTHSPRAVRSLDHTMTIARLISPALRSGLLMTAGTALIGVPFAIGLDAAAIVTGLTVGVMVVALALAGTAPDGRGTLPVSAQAVFDRGLAVGLLVVAVVFGIAGDLGAALLFATAGLSALVVTSITRYSASTAG